MENINYNSDNSYNSNNSNISNPKIKIILS